MSSPAPAALPDAMLIAAFVGCRVVAVDGCMPAQAFLPAAPDDAMAVYKEVTAKSDPRRVGLIGTSAGGALVLETGLRAKPLAFPPPAAINCATPRAVRSKTGDTFHTNAMLDNVLVSTEGFCDAAAALHANGHDL